MVRERPATNGRYLMLSGLVLDLFSVRAAIFYLSTNDQITKIFKDLFLELSPPELLPLCGGSLHLS